MSSPRYNEETIQQSRKVFGFAINHDPRETYIDCGSPRPSRMARRITDYVLERFQGTSLENVDSRVERLFFDGIEDVNTVFDHFLRCFDPAEAEAFITSEDVCHKMALIALRSDDDELSGIRAILDMRGDTYGRVVDLTNNTDPHLHAPSPDKERGCPFAGEAGEVHIDPLFARFVPWAGTLSLSALQKHGLAKK